MNRKPESNTVFKKLMRQVSEIREEAARFLIDESKGFGKFDYWNLCEVPWEDVTEKICPVHGSIKWYERPGSENLVKYHERIRAKFKRLPKLKSTPDDHAVCVVLYEATRISWSPFLKKHKRYQFQARCKVATLIARVVDHWKLGFLSSSDLFRETKKLMKLLELPLLEILGRWLWQDEHSLEKSLEKERFTMNQVADFLGVRKRTVQRYTNGYSERTKGGKKKRKAAILQKDSGNRVSRDDLMRFVSDHKRRFPIQYRVCSRLS